MTNRNLFYLPVIALSGFLFGCTPTGVPLAGDQVLESLCPDSGCADATPDPNQLTVKGPGATNIQSKVRTSGGVPADFVEFGGDCYASTYPNNRIVVTVNNVAIGTDAVSLFAADTTPRCIQGRYSVAIKGTRLPAGASSSISYNVKFEIVGIDADGAEHRNTNTGLFALSVLRSP
ncbi:MAG TPA: hypothetical protein PL182_07560 [Pseudobdellovibrionaceae bacterium]|nr:hypothetical protein [Pseudobdellovibrionaceae bacterium]